MEFRDSSNVVPYASTGHVLDPTLRLIKWFVLSWGVVVVVRHALYWSPALFWQQPGIERLPLAVLETVGYAVCFVSAVAQERWNQRALLIAGCSIALLSLLIALAMTIATADMQRGALRAAWIIWSAAGALVVPLIGLVLTLRAAHDPRLGT